MTIVFMSYDEWIKNNPECDVMDKCERCNGTGESECEECGSEIDCPDCKGDGKVNIGRQEYQKQLLIDKKKVDKFTKKQEEKTL